ncbi:hypothetical protein H6F95_25765 [Cyanobacteria bacterium FACHB-471]|nr:hypothetical protein [Cyanobacteria bacterium FACHB-471]
MIQLLKGHLVRVRAIAPSLSSKESVACQLDEIPFARICCHAKVVFLHTGSLTLPKDLALPKALVLPKAVSTSPEQLTPKLV